MHMHTYVIWKIMLNTRYLYKWQSKSVKDELFLPGGENRMSLLTTTPHGEGDKFANDRQRPMSDIWELVDWLYSWQRHHTTLEQKFLIYSPA